MGRVESNAGRTRDTPSVAVPHSGTGKALCRGSIPDCQDRSDAKTGKLSPAIISPRATDMIAEIAALISLNATAADLADTVHPHPTLSEVMGEAADDLFGLCCHAPKKEE